jgi:hypothetical protein
MEEMDPHPWTVKGTEIEHDAAAKVHVHEDEEVLVVGPSQGSLRPRSPAGLGVTKHGHRLGGRLHPDLILLGQGVSHELRMDKVSVGGIDEVLTRQLVDAVEDVGAPEVARQTTLPRQEGTWGIKSSSALAGSPYHTHADPYRSTSG